MLDGTYSRLLLGDRVNWNQHCAAKNIELDRPLEGDTPQVVASSNAGPPPHAVQCRPAAPCRPMPARRPMPSRRSWPSLVVPRCRMPTPFQVDAPPSQRRSGGLLRERSPPDASASSWSTGSGRRRPPRTRVSLRVVVAPNAPASRPPAPGVPSDPPAPDTPGTAPSGGAPPHDLSGIAGTPSNRGRK
jgi:hypothetical protein